MSFRHMQQRVILAFYAPSEPLPASSASILAPLALGGMLAVPLHHELASSVPLPTFTLFMAAAMSIRAFLVLARILTERGMLNSRAGAIAISCAIVNPMARASVQR